MEALLHFKLAIVIIVLKRVLLMGKTKHCVCRKLVFLKTIIK
jgi:hypothetical protein